MADGVAIEIVSARTADDLAARVLFEARAEPSGRR
jgi:hypothetical protein